MIGSGWYPTCSTCGKAMRLIRWDVNPAEFKCDACPPKGQVSCPADHSLRSSRNHDGICVLCKDSGFIEALP